MAGKVRTGLAGNSALPVNRTSRISTQSNGKLWWCVTALSLALSFPSAAPFIQFDTKTFQCGTIIEGNAGVVNAVFNMKNTGDSDLKFQSVRPSCWCVVVKYDSMVRPGATARIEAFMNTKGFHSGPVAKWISVSSNAKNEPIVRLTIKAVFQAQINVLNKYLVFNESRSRKDTLVLATDKTDFHIMGAEFHSSDTASSQGNPGWQKGMGVAVAFHVLPKDTTGSDGRKIFSYELIPGSFTESQGGSVIIRTNHPQKPEIAIPATLLK
jgi:hypothetical protein